MRAGYSILLVLLASCTTQGEEYGVKVGSFSAAVHDVSGDVYAVDENTLRIVNFNYDGEGPDAFFWISTAINSNVPDTNGVIIPYPADSSAILVQYVNADVILTLPTGYKVNNLKWLSVWCKQFAADFGHVTFPADFRSPTMVDLRTFPQDAVHGVSASIVIVLDTKRIRIEEFNYDGEGPDAFFLVGKGTINSANGMVVANEMGSTDKLGMYVNKDIELMLPAGIYIKDIDWLSVYCKEAATNFGHVVVTHDLIIPPYMSILYYGNKIGVLTTDAHGVSGDVFVIDDKRLWLRYFSYDGEGPDAYFIVGKRGHHDAGPSGDGITIANEEGSMSKLSAYDNDNIVLTLPPGTTVSDLVWLSVWCKQATTNFGSIIIPNNVAVPATVSIGQFKQLQHGVRSGDVTILDKKRIRITDLYYDGEGPDAFFVAGKGNSIAMVGATKIPDENGFMTILKQYTGQTIVLTLPGVLTVDDIDWISLYCIQFSANFGDVTLPQNMYAVPPYMTPEATDLPNCEKMHEKFNVAWRIDGNNVEFEFTGALDGDNGYMAFGISSDATKGSMMGADVMVVYLDNGVPKLQDYSINGYSLCSNGNGVCPDTSRSGSDDLTLISSYLHNGITTVRFTRPLAATNNDLDQMIPSNAAVYIVWAMGNVNDQKMVTKHTQRITDSTIQIDFGRTAAVNCEAIVGEEPEAVTPWKGSMISGKDVQTFSARIGPTGGKKGYQGITGQISWGIAWYINGYLIPEITVRRGETYTFKVEGGDDPTNQAKYHPFYITDDHKGGYVTKSDSDKANVKLLAGTMQNSTGTYGTDGRFCEYSSDKDPMKYNSFGEFKDTLTLSCDEGTEAGHFNWTVATNTPDLVYYQCFTHNYLGWKIHVVDSYESVSGTRSHIIQNGGALVIILTLCTVIRSFF